MSETTETILVMGVGNPLMRDEGIGPRVIELLLGAYEFPEHVEVMDAGTMGFMVLDTIRGFDKLIVVDAVTGTEQPPGTVMQFTPEDIAPNHVMHSLHDTRLIDVLQTAELLGSAPETIAIGMQIESIQDFVLELSEPCEAALPLAAGAVLEVLKELGVEPTDRKDPSIDAQIIEALRTFEPMPEADIPSDEPRGD